MTISDRVPAFSGAIHSRAGACESGRRVQLLRRTSPGKRLVGRDRSRKGGRWRIPADPLEPGAYFARVKAKRSRSVACRAARSPVIVIE